MNKSVFLTELWKMFFQIFNDKDPLWMTSDLRDKINWKNSIYKDYLKNGKTNYHYIKLQYAISEVSAAISKGKDE